MGEVFFSIIMKNKEEIKENILLYLFTISHRLIHRKEKDSWIWKGGIVLIKLVKRAQENDAEAFIQLIELCKVNMYKVAKAYLHNEEDAADAVADTILTCFEKIQDLKQPKYFKTWMIRILINTCNDMLKQRKRNCPMDEYIEIPTEDKETQNVEFLETLKKVGEKYQVVLVLYYVEGFSIKEIAKILDMKEVTVKARLQRGRKRYAEQLDMKIMYAGR